MTKHCFCRFLLSCFYFPCWVGIFLFYFIILVLFYFFKTCCEVSPLCGFVCLFVFGKRSESIMFALKVCLHRDSEIWSGGEMIYKNALIMQCRYRDVQVEGALCFPLVLYYDVRLIFSNGFRVYFRTKNFSYTLICHVYIQMINSTSHAPCNIIHHDLPHCFGFKPVTAIHRTSHPTDCSLNVIVYIN